MVHFETRLQAIIFPDSLRRALTPKWAENTSGLSIIMMRDGWEPLAGSEQEVRGLFLGDSLDESPTSRRHTKVSEPMPHLRGLQVVY